MLEEEDIGTEADTWLEVEDFRLESKSRHLSSSYRVMAASSISVQKIQLLKMCNLRRI